MLRRPILLILTLALAGVAQPFEWTRVDSAEWTEPAHALAIRQSDGALVIGYWGRGVWLYDDSTGTMRQIASTLGAYSLADIEYIAESIDSARLYIGVDCDGGFRLTYATGRIDRFASLGACVEAFYSRPDPADPRAPPYLYGSTFTGGVAESRDSGQSWTTVFLPPGSDDRAWCFARDDRGNHLIGTDRAIYRTYEFRVFDTLARVTCPGAAVRALAFIPPLRLFLAATACGLYRSWDLSRWYPAGLTGTPCHAIAYDAARQLVYVGAGERLNTNGETGGVYLGTGADTAWLSLGPPRASVQAVAIDRAGVVFIGIDRAGVWKLAPCPRVVLVRSDTVRLGGRDTVWMFGRRDTVTVHDTTTVHDSVNTHDTLTIVIRVRDTVAVHDTTIRVVRERDTLYAHDTLRITVRDTVTLRDTLAAWDCSEIQICDSARTVRFDGFSVAIFPNPSDGTISIAITGVRSIAAALYDARGNPLTARTVAPGVRVVLASGLVPGVYHVVAEGRVLRVVVLR